MAGTNIFPNSDPATGRGEFGWSDFPAFVMLPMVLIAIASGSSNAGSVEYVTKWPHIAHTVLIAIPLWLSVELLSRVSAKVLAPWQLPPAIPLITGALVSTQLNAFFSMFRNWVLTPYLAPGSHYFPTWPWNYGDATYRMEAALTISQVILYWLFMNFMFVRVFGFSRFGSSTLFGRNAPAESPAGSAVSPAPANASPPPLANSPLLSRMPSTIGRDIIALFAQEHYTLVHTSGGSTLVLMRFADAMTAAEMVTAGSRVHRSHWVAHNAVRGIEGEGEKMVLCLGNGLKVPVSRSYRLHARELLIEP
ncbi:MAG: LytTR family transcriptional regulator DNA-binding domain-containing protein [Sandarakinorhabdus sp.]|nr:LytTR family transcriptional regulator DNA-binding domain-containing protein [Sandarakinorhabdus sp.]